MSGQETVRVFEALGWQVARQRGSHIILMTLPLYHDLLESDQQTAVEMLKGLLV